MMITKLFPGKVVRVRPTGVDPTRPFRIMPKVDPSGDIAGQPLSQTVNVVLDGERAAYRYEFGGDKAPFFALIRRPMVIGRAVTLRRNPGAGMDYNVTLRTGGGGTITLEFHPGAYTVGDEPAEGVTAPPPSGPRRPMAQAPRRPSGPRGPFRTL
jgi:hypothetical protein